MREYELKAVVDDLLERRQRLVSADARLTFMGRLEDLRYDTPDHSLAKKDLVLRLRVYRNNTYASASLDWKGATEIVDGFKVRDELTTSVGDPKVISQILTSMGYVVTHEITRDIIQYDLDGTIIRFERYPQMDVLVEVEGDPEGIESAISVIGLPRDAFTTDSLPTFVQAFEARTGLKAALNDREFSELKS
jgi:adenylate cyclase class IV